MKLRKVTEEHYTNTIWVAPPNVRQIRLTAVERTFPAVAAGGKHAAYLPPWANKSSVLYIWGDNSRGQLGTNSITTVSSPVAVTGSIGHIRQLAIGGSTCVSLDDYGNIRAWGYNGSGNLGDNTVIPKSTPTLIPALRRYCKVSMGTEHTLALGLDKKVYAWGNNVVGQLGNFSNTPASTPIAVAGFIEKYRDINAAYFQSYAIDLGGDVYAWGANDKGQLGDGTNVAQSIPVLVLSGRNVIQVEGNSTGGMALTENGEVYVWGGNEKGELGQGDTVAVSTPILVTLPKIRAIRAASGGATEAARYAVDYEGRLWAWGANTRGNLGQSDNVARSTPVLVPTLGPVREIAVNKQGGIAVDEIGVSAIWVLENGLIECVGHNNKGQLGNGNATNQTSPTTVVVPPSGHGYAIPAGMLNEAPEKIVCVVPGERYNLNLLDGPSSFAGNIIGSVFTEKVLIEYEQEEIF